MINYKISCCIYKKRPAARRNDIEIESLCLYFLYRVFIKKITRNKICPLFIKLIDEHIYKNGQFEGLASYYDGNGNKMYEGKYVNGKRVGNWKFFEDNKVIKEVKAIKFSKELIKYEQRYTEKVSKTFEQVKKEQEKGK